ncbi:hypothetical protein [Spirosoma pulveris]
MDALSIDAITQRIADLQDETGLFASSRHNKLIFYRRPDTNVFFTAVTVFTLQNLRPKLPARSRERVDRITERARAAYPVFKNKDGLNTYNFWPTRPSQHFSNGYIFRHFDHFRIPDDIDDTAMVYLTTTPAPANGRWLKAKLAQHANGSQGQQIVNTYPDYRPLRAYSTWFGKNMGIDFDACALSNILYCVYRYNLPRDQHDADSLTYLRGIVESGRYVADPFQCAPHYARTSLISYHLARLMSAFDIPELELIRPRLVEDTKQLLSRAHNRLEKILLATALFRLGEPLPTVNLDGIERDFDTFHFFIAGLLTAYQQPWLRRFANRSLMQMRWQCEAHCWALVAEYVVMYEV